MLTLRKQARSDRRCRQAKTGQGRPACRSKAICERALVSLCTRLPAAFGSRRDKAHCASIIHRVLEQAEWETRHLGRLKDAHVVGEVGAYHTNNVRIST